jgi:hypothetical protein
VNQAKQKNNYFQKNREFQNALENIQLNNPQTVGNINFPKFQLQEPATQESIGEEIPITQDQPFFHKSSTTTTEQPTQYKSLYDYVSPNLQKMEVGGKPEYNEAEAARLRKQRKLAGLSLGLQSLFGGIAAATGAASIPNPIDGIGAEAINDLKTLDKDYFNQLADWNKEEQRAREYNTQANNQAAMMWAKDLNDKLRTEDERKWKGDEIEAERKYRTTEADADRKSREKMAADDNKIRQQAYNLDIKKESNYESQRRMQAIQRYEAEYDDLSNEYKILKENGEDAKANETWNKMQTNLKLREHYQSQLAEMEGLKNPPEEKPKKIDAQKFQEGFQNFHGGIDKPNQKGSNTGSSDDEPSPITGDPTKVEKRMAQSGQGLPEAKSPNMKTPPPQQVRKYVDPSVEKNVELFVNDVVNGKTVYTPREHRKMVEGVMLLGFTESQAEAYIKHIMKQAGKRRFGM